MMKDLVTKPEPERKGAALATDGAKGLLELQATGGARPAGSRRKSNGRKRDAAATEGATRTSGKPGNGAASTVRITLPSEKCLAKQS